MACDLSRVAGHFFMAGKGYVFKQVLMILGAVFLGLIILAMFEAYGVVGIVGGH